jgi:hypothetical protein
LVNVIGKRRLADQLIDNSFDLTLFQPCKSLRDSRAQSTFPIFANFRATQLLGETHLKKDSPGREKRNERPGGHIVYSIAYATDLNKRGPVLSLQVIQNVGKIWWAHQGSNLGPAD